MSDGGHGANELEVKYGLPANVEFCSRCTMSNQKPSSEVEFKYKGKEGKEVIAFDENGVCDACKYADIKNNEIDWDERERELIDLCNRYGAELIIDEAHSFGISGGKGLGLVADKQLSSQILATVYPLGKAVGSSGCFIAGSKILREYLINFCRSFIYSTAPSLSIVKEVGSQLNEMIFLENRNKVIENKNYFLERIKSKNILTGQNSAIVSVQYGDSKSLKNIESLLFDNGIVVKAILYPTVAKGTERLRICFHTFNSKKEIDLLLNILNQDN